MLHPLIDLPNPEVTISRSSITTQVDDPFELMCNVSVVDRLVVNPEVTWTKYVSSQHTSRPEDEISVDAVRTNTANGLTLSLDFPIVNTSDAGRYTCDAVVNITQISTVRSTERSENLSLKS